MIEWQIDDEALQVPVPAMLLQPLVENAFKYGVEQSTGEPHRVRIRALGGLGRRRRANLADRRSKRGVEFTVTHVGADAGQQGAAEAGDDAAVILQLDARFVAGEPAR